MPPLFQDDCENTQAVSPWGVTSEVYHLMVVGWRWSDFVKIIQAVTKQINKQITITGLGGTGAIGVTIYYLKCPVSNEKLWGMQKKQESITPYIGGGGGGWSRQEKLLVRVTRCHLSEKDFKGAIINKVTEWRKSTSEEVNKWRYDDHITLNRKCQRKKLKKKPH